MNKKVKTLIALSFLVVVLIIIYFMLPAGLDVSVKDGITYYQYDDVHESDLNVSVVYDLGEKVEIPEGNYKIDGKTLSKEKNKVTIKTDKDTTLLDMSKDLNIKAIGIDSVTWSYNEDKIYEDEGADKNKLEGTLLYKDGTKKNISDFTFSSTNDESDVNITISCNYGESTLKVPLVKISKIVPTKKYYSSDSKLDLDGNANIVYQDKTKKKIKLSDLSGLEEVELAEEENSIDGEYNGIPVTVKVNVLKDTAPNKYYAEHSKEYKDADYKYRDNSIFVACKEVETEKEKYILSHVIIENSSQIRGAIANDTYGGKREKGTTASKRLNWVLGINGSYFSYETHKTPCTPMVIKNGKVLGDGNANGGEICLKEDGTLFTPAKNIPAKDLVEWGVKESWGTADPLLIQDGRKLDVSGRANGGPYPRSAIGMVSPREYYVITAGTYNYKKGLTFNRLQEIFYDLGCTYARSFDGGGSATLVLKDKLINEPAQKNERPVIDFLYFVSNE